MSFARPHSPYDPPQRFVDMYEGKDIPAPVVGDWCNSMPIDTHPEKNPEAAIGNFGDEYAKIPVNTIMQLLLLLMSKLDASLMN